MQIIDSDSRTYEIPEVGSVYSSRPHFFLDFPHSGRKTQIEIISSPKDSWLPSNWVTPATAIPDSSPGKENQTIVGVEQLNFSAGTMLALLKLSTFWRYRNGSDAKVRETFNLAPEQKLHDEQVSHKRVLITTAPYASTPLSVVNLALIEGLNTLVLTTKVNKRQNLWQKALELPAGYTILADGTFQKAATRELVEETGINLQLDPHPAGVHLNDGIGHTHLNFLFVAEAPQVTRKDLQPGPEGDLVLMPATLETVSTLINHLGVSQPYMAAAMIHLARRLGNLDSAYAAFEHVKIQEMIQDDPAIIAKQRQSVLPLIEEYLLRV